MNGKDDFIVLGVNQKDKKIWRDFYDRYYAACALMSANSYPYPMLWKIWCKKFLFQCGKASVSSPIPKN